jgi:putative tributyrin esterase
VRPVLALVLLLLLLTACHEKPAPVPTDNPRLPASVRMQDANFKSSALGRLMPYRVILPSSIPPGQKLPVIFLLHGGGGNYRNWSNYSDVARFAEEALILVMPEGESSYYVNAAERPNDRFEDYIVEDLVADVESRFPVAEGRASRAIAGVSMGGFGAVTLSLKHPDRFAFVGGLSSAIDVPSRPFSFKRISQYRGHAQIFGPWGSQTRRANDPYVLVENSEPAKAPYLYLTCGQQEGLLPANRRFATLLQKYRFNYEFHEGPGGHDWNQWNRRLPELLQALRQHFLSQVKLT